ASGLARRYERQALTRARLIIANSERTRRDVIRCFGVEPTTVDLIYLGSDASWKPPTPDERLAARRWLSLPPDRPAVLFVGGLGFDDRKGFSTLWQAWRQLCARNDWNADLLVAGGGAASSEWLAGTNTAGLSGRIRFIGFTNRVFELLAAA